MTLPKDPFILLSVLNTRLRDFYPTLDECCKAEDIDKDAVIHTLASIRYRYSAEKNQFIPA